MTDFTVLIKRDKIKQLPTKFVIIIKINIV